MIPTHIIYDHLIVTCSCLAKISRISVVFKAIIHMIYMQFMLSPSIRQKPRYQNEAKKKKKKANDTQIFP